MKIENGIKIAGEFVGRDLGLRGLEFLYRRVGTFDIETSGLENLEILTTEPCLLVSNHLKPEEEKAQSSGLSPDALIISRIIQQATGEKIKIIHKSDNGWWSESSIGRYFQKNFGQPFGRGLSEGMGNVPVQKNPGSSNREFLKSVAKSVREKKSLLLFPEGNWYADFDASHKIEPGAAHLAKANDLKIIPIYIHGATSWKEGTEVKIFIGEPKDISRTY